jgi:hypothetical protein
MSKRTGAVLIGLMLVTGPGLSSARAEHGVDVDRADVFYFIVTADDRTVGTFPYDMTLNAFDPDAGWIEGDRVGYRCAYTFLVDDGEIVARVTFTKPYKARKYVVLNDKFMHEGERYYDGGWAGVQQVPDDECPWPTEPYKKLRGRPGPRPVIQFLHAGDNHVVEVRNYNNLKRNRHNRFRIFSATPDRVTVVAYRDRWPVMVVYYERLSDEILLTSNAMAPSSTSARSVGMEGIQRDRDGADSLRN